MNKNVQFTDSTLTTICSVFGCPQDPALYPNQATIDDSDSRYQAFINPSMTPAGFQSSCETALQQSLDTLAGSWGYGNPPGSIGSIEQAITYVNSTNNLWKDEAQTLLVWRDQVWGWAETQLEGIQANTIPMPSNTAAFISTMPAAPIRPTS